VIMLDVNEVNGREMVSSSLNYVVFASKILFHHQV